jgi:hypothetical protein
MIVAWWYAEDNDRTPALWAILSFLFPFCVPILLASLRPKYWEPANKRTQIDVGAPSKQGVIRELIDQTGIRPLGNKKRLGNNVAEQSNIRLLLFQEQADSKTYFHLLCTYAENNPPPLSFEMLLVRIKTIFDEPFGIVLPYEGLEDSQDYFKWLKAAIIECNESDIIFQKADHNYELFNQYVEKLYDWTVLLQKGVELDSAEVQVILSDPDGEGYPPLRVSLTEN